MIAYRSSAERLSPNAGKTGCAILNPTKREDMIMKKGLCAAFAAFAITFVAANGTNAQELTLRFGHVGNEDHSWHKGALKFADELESLTGGRIAVEVFPNETLGKEMDLLNGMALGTADLTLAGESLQNWAPMAALIGLPYAYETLEDVDRVINGEIGGKIAADIIENAPGRPIGYFLRDARNLTSRRPITAPDELDGLKLRISNVPLHITVWRALGANPTPMAFSEVFTSLQNGTIEAQENPLALIRSANFYEVQDYVNLTEHVRSWLYIIISEMTWNRLSEDDRDAVMEAMRRAQDHERELFLRTKEELRTTLESEGMEFVEVDKAAFLDIARDAVLSGLAEELRPYAEEIFDK